MEREDPIGIEIGDLMSRGTVDGLDPDVIHTILRNRVGYEFSICSELHTLRNSWIRIEQARRTQSSHVQQGNFILACRAGSIGERHSIRQGLSVRRDSNASPQKKCTFEAAAGNRFG